MINSLNAIKRPVSLKETPSNKRPFVVENTNAHTMGNYLKKYLEIKVHPYIMSKSYIDLVVMGKYDRQGGVSSKEKTGKLYNWQRPTAILNGKTLYILCFPGKDYVMHYANIIASYFAVTGNDYSRVTYYSPTDKECWLPIEKSHYSELPITEGVLVGYGLPNIFPDSKWIEKENFHFTIQKINDKKYTLLLVKHSFWGDIGGRLVEHLANLGHKKIIYIGKLGAIKEKLEPNNILATGSMSLLMGREIRWVNIFEENISEEIVDGKHITVPSVLFETKTWLESVKSEFDFVDPEIGHMAAAAVNNNAKFSYLHIVSDNVNRARVENLSNERNREILIKRHLLLKKINQTLNKSL